MNESVNDFVDWMTPDEPDEPKRKPRKRKARNADPTKCQATFEYELESWAIGATPKISLIQCIHQPGHEGHHFAAWGGSQKWRNHSWKDDGSPAATRARRQAT